MKQIWMEMVKLTTFSLWLYSDKKPEPFSSANDGKKQIRSAFPLISILLMILCDK